MICKACGIRNDDNAERCAFCGMQLGAPEGQIHGKLCRGCGFDNPAHSKFCARCGADLRHHTRAAEAQHRKNQKKEKKLKKNSKADRLLRVHPAVVTLVLLGVIALMVTGLQLLRNAETPTEATVPREVKSSNPQVENGVMAVASRFICSCGSCGEKPLDICTCGRAVEEREFIRNKLETGQSADQVIAEVDEMYGWKKSGTGSSDSVSKTAVDSRKSPALPIETTGAAVSDSKVVRPNDNIATVANREEVFSHFRCPCGKCGMDDLRSCTCSHPRGAKEVKAFVDQKIAEGKLTIAQLVNVVDEKYGGRKN